MASAQRELLSHVLLDDLYRQVLRTLAQYRAMPFLELTSLCDVGSEQLEEVIGRMEKDGVVRVVNPEDASEKIVTLRHKGFNVASHLGY